MEKKPIIHSLPGWKKAILTMKIIILLMFTALIQISANSFSQVTMNVKLIKGNVEQALKQIEEQSVYRFVYRSDLLKELPKVTYQVRESSLEEIMAELIISNGYSYELIENNVVVISKSDKPEIKQVIEQEPITVTGTITDTDGIPLPNATVVVESTGRGVSTDLDGKFIINVDSPEEVLLISYVGYITQRVSIGEKRTFNIQLADELVEADEVVVIGYGKTLRKDLTGSVASLPVHTLESTTFTNVAQTIQGQLPGVYVLTGDGSPGSPAQISIRGISSLLGDISPLIVVDEVPMPENFDLYSLDVNDISSVDILKGASSAAIYGSRAASGVILISTKKGMPGVPVVNYSYNLFLSQLNTDVNVLNAEEWKYMMLEGAYNGAAFSGYTDPHGWFTYNNMTLPGYFGDYNTNWFALMLQNAVSQTHSLSLRGGGGGTNYNASLGYSDDQGVMKETGFKRYNLNLALDSKINKFITWGTSFRGNLSDRDVATSSLYQAAIKGRPDQAAYNEDGSIALDIYYLTDGRPNLRENPLSLLFDNEDNQINQTMNATGYINFQILPNLSFRTRFTYSNSNTDSRQYFASTTTAGSGFAFAYKGRLYESDLQRQQSEFENILNYKKAFNKHSFDAILATSFLTEDRKYNRTWVEDFPDDHTQTQLWQGATFREETGYYDKAAMLSYISRFNYKYDDKYLLTASIRMDGSSKFAPENAYGSFPAVAVAWIASNENFLKNINWINLLKLRVSAGKTGMANVGYYKWRTLYETTRYEGSPAVVPVQAGNERLKWESTVQSDIGMDFSLFKSRLRGSIGYYTKNTEGLLYPFTMAPSTSYTSTIVNFGEISNKGMDIEFQGDIIKTQNVLWTFAVNFNNNKNIVEKLDKDYITSLDGTQTYRNTMIKEGEPLGLIYGFKTDGIYGSQAEVDAVEALNPSMSYQGTTTSRAYVGEIKYVDLNGDGYVDMDTDQGNPDRTIIGKSLPDFSGGFSNNLNYKNWSLNIYANYSVGNDKIFANELYMFGTNASAPGNVWRTALQRWTPENPDSKYPSFRIGRTFPSRWFSDYSVYDASYLKIQNVQLEYAVPASVLDRLKFASAIRLTAGINNLYTFTKYPGPNPQSFDSSSTIQGAAQDYATYPESRSYNIGIKLTLK